MESMRARGLRIIRENPEMFEALEEYDRTGRLPTVAELKERKRKVSVL